MKARRKAKRGVMHVPTYGLVDVMLASPTSPTPEATRVYQLSQMWQGLRALETDERPSPHDWRVCSDAVNLLETLVEQGHMLDASGLLADAVQALAEAGRRHLTYEVAIRLDGRGIQAVRAVLEDYRDALEQLPHRVMVEAHRATERRIREIQAGKGRPHDVEVVDL